MTTILEMRGITKEYRGVSAVQDVTLSLEAGEVHALLGENGAGKSTLAKMIAGAVAPTRGDILLSGVKTVFATPKDALDAGIAMVYQENSLVPALSVAQNIFLGQERFFNRQRGINIAAQQFLQSLNFSVDPVAAVSTLGVAQRQMVEIARAVRQKARVLIFDEPTASLTPEEKHHFFGLMARLKQSGVAIIFITHALEEALQHANRITVLRDGQHVTTGPVKAFDRAAVIEAMIGRPPSEEIYGTARAGRRPREAGRKILSVQNLSLSAVVRNTSFSIFAGQVTGMFGLIGSGRTETAKIIAGILKRDAFHGGQIKLDGRPVRYRVPRQAVRDGVVYITEDRKLEGLFETMSIEENIGIGAMTLCGHLASGIDRKRSSRLLSHWVDRLSIRALDGNVRVVELSGGNQQKVVIAKSLVQEPKLVIFDEPTRGVDVGAIAEIHRLINELADEGLGVIVISSYLPEMMRLSDRILVTRQGKVVEEFPADEADERKIMFAAVH